MKILYVNEFYSLVGGTEQYMLSVCRELENRGHRSAVVYGNKTHEESIIEDRPHYFIPGITSYKCKDIKGKLTKLSRIILNEQPDIVFIHQVLNSHTIELLIKTKSSIRYVHDYKLTCISGRRMLSKVNRPCFDPLSYTCQLNAYRYRCMPRNPTLGLPQIKDRRRIMNIHKKTDLIVASKFMKEILIKNGFAENKIEILPYFTHLPELVNVESSNNKTILCVSRLTPEKGVNCLLTAFSRIDMPAELIIVGDGPSLAELKEKARVLGISPQVTFTGWLPNREVSQLYRQSCLVVIPSVWPEPFGIVGIEAMAHAKPVVGFDVGGISEWLVDAKTGYLVTRGNEAALAERINYLLGHKEKAFGMGRQGRQLVEQRFTKEVHIKKLLCLMENIVHPQS